MIGVVLPAGFVYRADVLTEDEERGLLEEISALPLAPVEFRGFIYSITFRSVR